jgi:hypothetical protein
MAIIGAGIYYGGGGRMPFTKIGNASKGFGGFSLVTTGGFFSKQTLFYFLLIGESSILGNWLV